MAATASGAASALLRGKYAVVYVTVPSVEVGTKIAR